MKARMWKGPFSGKIIEANGQPLTLVVTGPKRMSRKARYEWIQEQYRDPQSRYAMMGLSGMTGPRVDATYRMVIKRGYSGNEPWTHPDGSIFYEFVSKREF